MSKFLPERVFLRGVLLHYFNVKKTLTEKRRILVMLCIWWDQKDMLYYELLKPNDTINGERYNNKINKNKLVPSTPWCQLYV